MYGANYTDHGRDTHELFSNVTMYYATDKYGLLATNSLAVEKFTLTRRHALITPAGCALFIGVARKAYEETPPTNDSLRLVIAQLCAKNYSKLFAPPKFRPMLHDNAKLGTDMAAELGKMYADIHDSL
jgi:hypothetical protein